MIRCLGARLAVFNDCWISPSGVVIDVPDGHPVNAAVRILVSIFGSNIDFEEFKRTKLRRLRQREDTYLRNHYHWIYLKQAGEYRVPGADIEIYFDDLICCNIPEDGIMTFEQIQAVNDMTGWEYYNSDKTFNYKSGPKGDGFSDWLIDRNKFKQYEDKITKL